MTLTRRGNKAGKQGLKTGSDTDNCPSCNSGFNSSSSSIQCFFCKLWYHQDCCGLKASYFAILAEVGDHLEYRCVKCVSSPPRFEDLNIKLNDINNAISDISLKLSEHQSMLNEVCNPSNKPTFAQIAARNINPIKPPPATPKDDRCVLAFSNIEDEQVLLSGSNFHVKLSKLFSLPPKVIKTNINRTGLIFVEFHSVEESSRILEGWKGTFLGRNTKVNFWHEKPTDGNKLIIKNVPTCYSEAAMLADIKTAYNSVDSVKRFVKGSSPIPVVLLTCRNSEHCQKILSDGIIFDGLFLFAEKYIPRKTPVRCFNCQKFGHSVKFCKSSSVCGKCAGSHQTRECASAIKKCANCGKDHHSSFSGCEKFQIAYNKLNFL